MPSILITAGSVRVSADLNDSRTAALITAALPFEAVANRWGDEIYFEIPVSQAAEPAARADVQVGDVAYWPPGKALCLFFGATPASQGPQPRAASPVNLVGRLRGDPGVLRAVRDGEPITVSAE
jgi:hypothetical protein